MSNLRLSALTFSSKGSEPQSLSLNILQVRLFNKLKNFSCKKKEVKTILQKEYRVVDTTKLRFNSR